MRLLVVRNATTALTVIYSPTRKMVPQSLNDLEAVFTGDDYCNSLRASVFYQDCFLLRLSYVVFTAEQVVNVLFTKALFSKQS